MKTLILFFFFTICTYTAQAQITKGNWMVGGDGYFSSTKYETSSSSSRYTQIRLNPNVGYFIIDKLSGGIQFNVSFVGISGRSDDSGKGQSYGISPYVRYYFLKPESRFNAFAQANYYYRYGHSEYGTESNSTGYNLKAGGVAFLNSNIGVELIINYSYLDLNPNQVFKREKQLLIGLGLQVHLEKE